MNQGADLSKPGQSDDHESVRACLKGDNRAFDDLVNRHKDRVFNLCYWFLGDYHEADDIAQDVFIKVFRSLGSFQFNAKFSTWLYRIAINTCKNRVTSLAYRYKKWTDRLESVSNMDETVLTAGVSNSPEAQLQRKESARHIHQTINKLSADKKAVVVLRDIEGLSYDEISNVTGLAVGTVKSKLARARASLQQQLKGEIQ